MIEFRNFTFQYDSQAEATLKNIDLIIHPGEKILIIGPSGSGKSTLGKCLNGIIPQNEKGSFTGQLTINGKNFSESSIYDLSLEVGTVLQDTDSQFVGLTVAEDIAFSLENEMIEQKEMQEAVNFWAKKTNLLAQLDKRPQDLSGGQKQRVAMAGVLIDETPILLFDEPLLCLITVDFSSYVITFHLIIGEPLLYLAHPSMLDGNHHPSIYVKDVAVFSSAYLLGCFQVQQS